MTSRIPWAYTAVMPVVWFGHVGLSYLVAGLHCHQELLEGDILGLTGVRVVQLALTFGAAAALLLCALRVWRPLHASGESAERNFALATALLAGIFLVYLAWTVAAELTVQPCHR